MSSTLGLVVLITMFVLAVGAVTLAEMSSPVLSLEAERAQLSGQFTVGADPNASGGQYVSVEAPGKPRKHFDGENVALLCFQIDEDGLYAIYADVLGPNEASNSFVVRIDYFDPWVWDFPRSKEYTYQGVTSGGREPVETELAAGQHVVGFHLHEPGARLDAVDIAAVRGGHPKRCQGQSDNTEPNTTTTSSTEAEESKGKPKGDRKSSTISTEPTSTTITDPTTTITDPATTISETTTSTQEVATTAPSTTTSAPSTTSSTAGTTTTTNPTTTAPPPVVGVVWSAGMESGNLSEWSYFSESSPGGSSAYAAVASSPVHSGGYSMGLTIEDAVTGTGIRAAVHGNDAIAGYSGADNLPTDAYYSAWFYVPVHVDVKPDHAWNIFQWKQTCQRNGSTTRCFLEAVNLVDLGDRYGFRLRSRTDSAGDWDMDNYVILAKNENVNVRAGQWFHLECRRVYSTGFEGRVTCWANGELLWDVAGIRTEHEGIHGDVTWEWDVKGAKWRREWTVNNYNVGNQPTPSTHTIYIDDATIALNRVGP